MRYGSFLINLAITERRRFGMRREGRGGIPGAVGSARRERLSYGEF